MVNCIAHPRSTETGNAISPPLLELTKKLPPIDCLVSHNAITFIRNVGRSEEVGAENYRLDGHRALVINTCQTKEARSRSCLAEEGGTVFCTSVQSKAAACTNLSGECARLGCDRMQWPAKVGLQQRTRARRAARLLLPFKNRLDVLRRSDPVSERAMHL